MASVSQGAAPRDTRFRRGLRIEFRVIGALMMRELHTRYGRENIGYLWLILEPLLLCSMIALLHARGATHFGSDLNPVPMAMIGYCNFMAFRSIVNRSEGSLEGSATLLYHRTITPFDVLAARALLEAAGTFLAFCVLMGLAMSLGMAKFAERPLYFLLGVIMMVWLSFGLSMIIAAVTLDNRSVGRLIHPITYLMLPLSGAFFVLSKMPEKVQNIFYWVPMAHIFELLRYGWFRSARPDFIDPLYLGSWISGTTLIGLLLLSTARKRIQLT